MIGNAASILNIAWVKLLLACIGAVVIGFLAYVGYQYAIGKNLSEKLPTAGEKVVFSDRGMAETYEMTEFSFTEIPPEVVAGMTLLESKSVPTGKGQSVVIAKKPETTSMLLGLRTGDEIASLLDDGTNKSDLVVTQEGIAVFAVAARPTFFPEDVASVSNDDADSNEPDEEGSAMGPVVIPITKATPAESSTSLGGLYAFDLETKKVLFLGSGKSPRLSPSGSILAIGTEGVVDIDPITGSRIVVISYRDGDAPGSSLSSDGSIAALRRDGSATVEFFRVTDSRGVYLGQIFSSSPMYGTAVLSEEHIFVRTGKDTVSLYALTDDSTTVQPRFAELGLLLPN